jgi:phosphoribosylformylglycinamidine synthase
VEGIQDMGAAGLTSSSSEMAGRAGTGVELELSLVPLREEGMTPYEIMLSESQERMLLVAKSGQEERILSICRKWGLEGVAVGRVTKDGDLLMKWRGEAVGRVPVKALTDQAPVYERPLAVPGYLDQIQSLPVELVSEPRDYGEALLGLLRSFTIAGKEWVYQQFDHTVQTNTLLLPGSGSAVLRMKESRKALAMTVDGNSLYGILNPYLGGAIAVCEAARNLVCVGARPLAVTDCLNFANPEKPDVMWQFAAATEGIADACRQLGTPVVSGNVSFYNETAEIGIYPTPVVGMLGLIDDPARIVTPWFKSEGDRIVLLGRTLEELGGSEYMRVFHGREGGTPPTLRLPLEAAVQDCCLSAIRAGIIKSAQDCSEGGLAVASAESCVSSPRGDRTGARMELKTDGIRRDALLFGESQSRFIVTVEPDRLKDLEEIAASKEVSLAVIGRVGGNRLSIRVDDGPCIDLPVDEIHTAWRHALRGRMRGESHVR